MPYIEAIKRLSDAERVGEPHRQNLGVENVLDLRAKVVEDDSEPLGTEDRCEPAKLPNPQATSPGRVALGLCSRPSNYPSGASAFTRGNEGSPPKRVLIPLVWGMRKSRENADAFNVVLPMNGSQGGGLVLPHLPPGAVPAFRP